MEPRVGTELLAQSLDRGEHSARIVGAAQARLPRPGDAVIHGGDAVAHRLPVAFHQRHVDGKTDAGPRHQLPLECVAVDIDDTGQHVQAARIDAAAVAGLAADGTDRTVRFVDVDGRVAPCAADQCLSALNSHV